LAYILDDTECRLNIADTGWAGLIEEAIARTTLPMRVIWSRVDDSETRPSEDYETMLAAAAGKALGDACRRENDAPNIYHMSGTTGHQKGVVLTHRNIYSHALSTIAELKLVDADVWAHIAPMFHLADAWATWALTWVGARHVMAGRFEPASVLKLID